MVNFKIILHLEITICSEDFRAFSNPFIHVKQMIWYDIMLFCCDIIDWLKIVM